MSASRGAVRPLFTGLRLLAVMTALLGVAYPLAILGIGAVVAPAQAAGSLLKDSSGRVVGSEMIGQSFTTAEGAPDPRFFQSRPSAAGEGYDGLSSGGSNLGPSNPELVALIRERRASIAAFEGCHPASVPADALTASGSGLDPHISPAYARLQVERVARARGVSPDAVAELLARSIQHTGPWLPGQDKVNVLRLNLALDALSSTGSRQ